MKVTRFFVVAGTALVLSAASVGAYAQASDANAAAAPAASSKAANRALSKSVRRALTKNKQIDSTNIYIRARDGVIRLTGFVPENAQIQAATDTVQGVSGVTSVDNKLTVKQPSGGGN
ncbi:BON domain-containing protein [Pararobbsia silviterrae]|uniref:BON domain-containing protein n=1 Tax=Pararobbsia silviterrae TaxID=1792498 RepID=A0A494XUR7_9BURK|nr:BON domain-containing protein [Pararobbsia silviterrae]RKP53451.1 BON domain-containing protein [Pararobbsia silviterrae]